MISTTIQSGNSRHDYYSLEGDLNHCKLYVHYSGIYSGKKRKKLFGHYKFINSHIFFQFATPQTINRKIAYAPALKMINYFSNTWIAVNADRKGRKTEVPDYIEKTIQYFSDCIVEKILLG